MARSSKSLFLVFSLVVSSLLTTALAIVASAPTSASASIQGDGNYYQYANNDGVSQIYNFGEHTCGVQDDVLWCWGSNGNYRIGRYRYYEKGVAKSTLSARPMPRLARDGYGDGKFQLCPRTGPGDCASPTTTFDNSGTKGIVGLGGLYTTCAIQGSAPSATTGTVYCMGYNDKQQAGQTIAGNVDRGVQVPAQVPNGNDGFTNSNVIAVDGGNSFSCAIEGATDISTEGALYCWGSNDLGQLAKPLAGVGSTANPVKALASGDFSNIAVSSLSIGFEHGCAVEGGKAFCWGNNGDAVGANDVQIWPPKLISGGPSSNYGLLLTTGGGGRAGQNATTSKIGSPTAVQLGTDGFTNTGVTQVSAGYRHSCAIQTGSVYCWGNNDSGQLGDGSVAASASPKKVLAAEGFTNTNVTQVVAGDHFTCALESGSVYCWGDQQLGRLGNSNVIYTYSISTPFVPQASPVKVADGAIAGGNSGITSLAFGSAAHSCVLKGDKAYCWGAGRRWATLSDGSTGYEVYYMPGQDYSEDAPQPREVQWGPIREVSPYDPVYPPGLPTDVVATAGWNKVTVTWKAPVYKGSYPITNYLVTSNPGSKFCISTISSWAALESCEFTNLTPGVEYKFTVQALNGGGWGDRSLEMKTTTSPKNLRLTSYNRQALNFFQGQQSDVKLEGIAPGYKAGTKVVPWVRVSDGAWVSYPTSALSVDRLGKYVWNRRFAKNLNSKEITVKFEIEGNFSNTVVVGSVKTRGIFSMEATESDLGGIPESGNPQTDIQFGFDSEADITSGLPLQFDGSNLKPGSTVSATLERTTPTGSVTTLWGPPETIPAKSIAPAVQEISATVGTPMAATPAFTATGFTPTTFVRGGQVQLPAGLNLDPSTGVVTGTPSSAGVAIVTINAFAGSDVASAILRFNIVGATSVSPAFQTVRGTLGSVVSTPPLSQAGLQGDVTYGSIGALPEGLTLDPSTGAITGVPMVASKVTTAIRATGATSGTADTLVTFDISYTNSSATVDENGDVFAVLNLPSNLGPGIYSVVFAGNAPDGTPVSETNIFELSEGMPTSIFSELTNSSSENNLVFAAFDATPKPSGPQVQAMTAITPDRLVDTRQSSIVEAGGVLEVQVAGRGGVPTGATTAVLNVTATDHVGDGGYLTVYACEATRRETSNLNIDNGGTVANAVTVELGASGKVCIYTLNRTHIIVDVTGFADVTSTLRYSSMTPTRIMDTRQTYSDTKRLSEGQTVELSMPSAVPSGAEAVALNVTLATTDAWGWASVYPCGQPRPNTSTVNALAGATIAGSALALLGTGKKVCIYTSVGTDLIVDVFGWYSAEASAGLQSHEAMRLLDTRRGVELSTITENGETIEVADDEAFVLRPTIPANSVSAVSTDVGYAGDASAVVANLTVTMPEAEGYLTVFDCATEMPIVSSLNFTAGETRANQIVIPTSTDSLCVFNSAAAHIIVDVVGRYIVGGPAPT